MPCLSKKEKEYILRERNADRVKLRGEEIHYHVSDSRRPQGFWTYYGTIADLRKKMPPRGGLPDP